MVDETTWHQQVKEDIDAEQLVRYRRCIAATAGLVLNKMMENYKHTTVLLDEAVNGLNIRPDGIYIDGTFGRGGHARLILCSLVKRGVCWRSIATQAIAVAKTIDDSRFAIITDLFPRWANTLPVAILSARSTAFSSIWRLFTALL